MTFYVGATVSALFYLLASCRMASRVAGASKDETLLAGLILLSTFYFIGLAQYSRMDLLFSALILAAHRITSYNVCYTKLLRVMEVL